MVTNTISSGLCQDVVQFRLFQCTGKPVILCLLALTAAGRDQKFMRAGHVGRKVAMPLPNFQNLQVCQGRPEPAFGRLGAGGLALGDL